ncbi:MAG: hypothetical protein JNK58_09440 [Phycisphaerae bacterium]|nr:hypothetical protein [Phycisphaerae bacterium]
MRRYWITFKLMIEQEKKKAYALGVLGLLLLAALVRAGLTLGPRSSAASPTTEVSGISSLASAGREAVSRAIASDDALHGGRFIDIPRSPPTTRNLFAMDPSWYAPEFQDAAESDAPPEQSEQATQIPRGGGYSEGAGGKRVESASQNADDLAERQRAQLLEETTGWRLSSVVMGERPIAVVEVPPIGGRGAPRSNVVRVGQPLREWLVIEITSSAVVLEKQKVRVRLSLAKS